MRRMTRNLRVACPDRAFSVRFGQRCPRCFGLFTGGMACGIAIFLAVFGGSAWWQCAGGGCRCVAGLWRLLWLGGCPFVIICGRTYGRIVLASPNQINAWAPGTESRRRAALPPKRTHGRQSSDALCASFTADSVRLCHPRGVSLSFFPLAVAFSGYILVRAPQ